MDQPGVLSKNTTALGLGGGWSLWEDLDALEEMMEGPWPGDVFICNDVGCSPSQDGRIWEGPVDHWCTLHPEKLGLWMREREKAGLPGGFTAWSLTEHSLTSQFTGWRTGSSGLYMASVAIKRLFYPRMVLCGVPMDAGPNTFSGKGWNAHRTFVNGWKKELPTLKEHLRSFSGWTREILGAPTREWIGEVRRHGEEPCT